MSARPLITTDCHYGPPPDLADGLPAKFRARVPHLETRRDGTYYLRPDLAEMMRSLGGMGGSSETTDAITAMLAEGIKVDLDDPATVAFIVQGNVAPEASPGFTADAFLRELARDGVVGAVLIGSSGFAAMDDVEASIAWSELHNDWAAETFGDHLDAFAPSITLPLLDVAASVRELERAAGLGLRPLLLPDVIPSMPYSLPEWEPLWEAAAGLAVPVATHVSGPRALYPWAQLVIDRPRQQLAAFALTSVGMVETMTWFACEGILERHPELERVLTECSAGWLAWAMQCLDHHYLGRYGNEFQEKRGNRSVQTLAAPPSYYIKRQVSCTFMDDPVAIHNREFTGLDCLLWGNDYPHSEGVFPHSQEAVDKQFSGVPEAEIMQIVHDNAARIYNLTV